MQPQEKGRFCTNCRQTVIDFSALPDQELYNYFKNRKIIPCGRFHSGQLNKLIKPPQIKKNRWWFISRSLAAAIAFLTIKNSNAALLRKAIPVSNSPSPRNAQPLQAGNSSIISGTVKNSKGDLLESATVTLNDSVIAITDRNGFFQFEWKEKKTGSYTLYFKYPGLITLVRQYHTAMQSTTFNVTLTEPYTQDILYQILGGEPVVLTTKDLPCETLLFSAAAKKPDVAMKKKLALLATWMRNNPGVAISFSAYGPYITLNNNRQNEIKKYLVEKEGIGSDRLIFQVHNTRASGMEHTHEIVIDSQ
jgi:hypothetical protein